MSLCPLFLLPGILFPNKLPARKPFVRVLLLEEPRLSHVAFNTMGLNEIIGGLVKIEYRYRIEPQEPSFRGEGNEENLP